MNIGKVPKHFCLALSLWIWLLPLLVGCGMVEAGAVQLNGKISNAAETDAVEPAPSGRYTVAAGVEPTPMPEGPIYPIEPPVWRTTDEAAEMITAFLAEKKSGLLDAAALKMMEIPAQRVWDEMEAQLFIVTEGIFQNEAFLIRHERVIQLGTAAGGKGLTSLAVTDLDQNGQSELLFSYNTGLGTGFGPGTQTRVGMYEPAGEGTSQVIEADLAYLGIAGLKFENPTTVNLTVIEPDDGSKVLRYLEDLGQLSIENTETGKFLIFQMAPDLSDTTNLLEPNR